MLFREESRYTGDKLVDDDKVANKYADTNANPYADDTSNNDCETWRQVWLDTTRDAANKDNIQS